MYLFLRRLIFFSTIGFILFFSHTAYACRFWCAVGERVPPKTVTQELLELPNALKVLGNEYPDGWSVAYYKRSQPMIFRGSGASHLDSDYDKRVRTVARKKANIVVSHLRRASSGCVEGVANPHPFERVKDGKRWIFGHNGGIEKPLLIDLIGKEYLNNNLPTTCTDNAPYSWIDSELYFIFLLKKIEDNDWDAEKGLKAGLLELYQAIEEEKRYLNFFLSDGQTLWAFRKGNTLFYHYDKHDGVAKVSSSIPHGEQGDWELLPEGTLAILRPGEAIELMNPDETKGL